MADAIHSSPWLKKLKKLDYYSKTHADVAKRSSLGGVFAILVAVLMCGLFLSEFSEWLRPRTKDTLSVDVVRGEVLTIMFDITFHRLTCEEVTIDLIDESGAHFTAIGHLVHKAALDADRKVLREVVQDALSNAGNVVPKMQRPGYCHPCKSELPTEKHEEFEAHRKKNTVPPCCNTCPALMLTFQMLGLPANGALSKEPCLPPEPASDRVPGEVGCRASGYIHVNKIGGNMHVAAGKSGTQSHGTHTHHMHRVNFETLKFFNISHTIHTLHFGGDFHGKVDPLNGVEVWEPELAQYTYLVNVVPTTYVRASGHETPSHQYSYTVHRERVDMNARTFKLPGLFIKYSFDALRMTKRDHPESSFSHFLTRICALLGGSYVFMGLVYRGVSTTAELIAKKND